MIELSNYISKKYYLFNHLNKIYNKLCINYIDVGSSHNQNISINYLKNYLKINTINFDAFETHGEEDELTKTYRKVLSDKKKLVTFYENFQPETSSIYPVSENYRNIFEENFVGRNTKNKIELNAISLDDLNLKNINLIKIDSQGYNYEILNGARKLLNESFPILIIECWNLDIYKQDYNIGDQISILKKMGYILLDIENSHSWKISNNYNLHNSKKLFVGCDMVFIKEDLLFKNLIKDIQTMNNVLSVIIFLDIYGFKSLILKIIEKQEFIDMKLKDDLLIFLSNNSHKVINFLSKYKINKYLFNKIFKFKIDGIFYHY